MIVDASAMLAILLSEPEAKEFSDKNYGCFQTNNIYYQLS